MEDLEAKTLSEKKSAGPDTAKSSFKLADIVSFSALILTLAAALLYYLGSTYYSGYLSFWGLPEELFTLSREKSVMSGVIAYALVCLRELLPYLNPWVVGVVVLIIFAVLCSVKYIERILNRLVLTILVVTSPLFLAYAIVISSQWASNQGRVIAETEQKGILSGQSSKKPFSSQTVLYVRNESKSFDQFSGHLINTSATHCALYNKATGVSIFPLANVSRMVIRENKAGNRQ